MVPVEVVQVVGVRVAVGAQAVVFQVEVVVLVEEAVAEAGSNFLTG